MYDQGVENGGSSDRVLIVGVGGVAEGLDGSFAKVGEGEGVEGGKQSDEGVGGVVGMRNVFMLVLN